MFEQFKEALSSGDLQLVVESSLGKIIIIVLAVVLLLAALIFSGQNRQQNKVKPMAYSGVAIALAMVLSQIKLFALPQGGSITLFSMFFIVLIGYFYGVRQGILAGIVYGLLQLVFGGWVMHPVQLLLDYPLAFGALGLSGLFSGAKHGLVKGLAIGVMGRFVFHFISGIVFFSEYTPPEWNSILYSFWYNFSYTGIEGLVTAIILLVPGVIIAFNRIKKSAIA
jgi:thiamine transporter